jgi:hypothetical protein
MSGVSLAFHSSILRAAQLAPSIGRFPSVSQRQCVAPHPIEPAKSLDIGILIEAMKGGRLLELFIS